MRWNTDEFNIYRYGNDPICLKELQRKYGSTELLAINKDMGLAWERVRAEGN